MSIQLAESDAQILSCFPTLSQLRPHLEFDRFLDQVHRQQQQGYQLAFVEVESRAVAIAGFRVSENLFAGKFMYVDDLVVDENARSQQHGQNLFNWLIAYAKQQGCVQLHLDSGVQRFDAHRFYLRQRMKIASHHFSLDLWDDRPFETTLAVSAKQRAPLYQATISNSKTSEASPVPFTVTCDS
jgi:GNAT superfamily N-acetyltransferase